MTFQSLPYIFKYHSRKQMLAPLSFQHKPTKRIKKIIFVWRVNIQRVVVITQLLAAGGKKAESPFDGTSPSCTAVAIIRSPSPYETPVASSTVVVRLPSFTNHESFSSAPRS